jgi:protein gp37
VADQRDGGIAWSDETWNQIRGCSRVSTGCTRCYAEEVAARFSGPGLAYEGLATRGSNGLPRWTGEVRMVPEHLADPLRWKRPRRVFVNSMSDLFHEKLTNEQIAAVFGVMAAAPRHTFQVLTKRAKRMREWFAWIGGMRGPSGISDTVPAMAVMSAAAKLPELIGPMTAAYQSAPLAWPLPNVWLGVSCENQETADERIPDLLHCPAAVRFISYEPALGPVDFSPWINDNPGDETGREERRDSISSGAGGLDRGKAGRIGLEDRSASERQMERDRHGSTGQSPSDRRSGWEGVSNGQDHDRREADVVSGTQAGVESAEGANTGWLDAQSQGRREGKKYADKPGAGDVFGAYAPRFSDRVDGSARGDKPSRETDERTSVGNSASIFDRDGDAGGNREGVRGRVSDGLEDRARGEATEAAWSDPGLYGEATTGDEGEKRHRTLRIHQIIVGGESGPRARPFNIEWARSIVQQCRAAGSRAFVKQICRRPTIVGPADGIAAQWPTHPHFERVSDGPPPVFEVRLADSHGGDPTEWPADLRVREFPAG